MVLFRIYCEVGVMCSGLRKTGISVVGDAPWGTHFCHFYETKHDLLETLVPYFKAGLESNEFCLWVLSDSDLITVEEAKAALVKAVPDLDRHLSNESIEIINGRDWYLEKNVLNLKRLTSAWDEKLKQALARGYVGLRASGDTFWLAEKDWKDFFAYEKQINDWVNDQPMTVLCTYPLSKSGAAEVLDVVQAHQFVIARRQGRWEAIETPQLIQAKAEIRKLNVELEQRVVERTNELKLVNEELIREISQRRRVEEELREGAADLTEAQRVAKIGNWVLNPRTNKVTWSEQLYQMFEIEKSDFDGRHKSFLSRIHPDDQARVLRTNAQTRIEGSPFDIEYRIITPNNEVKTIREVGYAAHDEAGNVIRLFGTAQDITEYRSAVEELKEEKEILEKIFENIPVMIGFVNEDGRVKLVNREWERTMGWTLNELQDQNVDIFAHAYPDLRYRQQVLDFVAAATGDWVDLKIRVRDGRVIDAACAIVQLSHGTKVAIAQNITERKRAEERISATSEQLRALSASAQSAKEEEGTRIARELHDELGGALTSLKWELESFNKVIVESNDQSLLHPLREKVEAMLRLSETTISAVRRISSELRPSILDDLGLAAAIEWQGSQFEARTGIICRSDCSVESIELDKEQSTAIFRILQEALTNILRHAQSTRVNIVLKQEAGEIVLTVSDNGRGITDDEISRLQSLGLLGMRERALLIGAELDITGIDGVGTVVTVRLPESKRILRTDSPRE